MPSETADQGSGAEKAARRLAMDYLDFWSAPNALALESAPEFYAPRVEFHGREISARALFEEKRRFVRRWPVRSYSPRPETTTLRCEGTGSLCSFRTVFDFVAINPERLRRSEGVSTLELMISVVGERPVIVSETSRVVRRGPTRRIRGFENAEAGAPEAEWSRRR